MISSLNWPMNILYPLLLIPPCISTQMLVQNKGISNPTTELFFKEQMFQWINQAREKSA